MWLWKILISSATLKVENFWNGIWGNCFSNSVFFPLFVFVVILRSDYCGNYHFIAIPVSLVTFFFVPHFDYFIPGPGMDRFTPVGNLLLYWCKIANTLKQGISCTRFKGIIRVEAKESRLEDVILFDLKIIHYWLVYDIFEHTLTYKYLVSVIPLLFSH